MAKTKTPLLSLAASGSLGGVLTHRQHRRQTIAERKPIPPDQRTPAQLLTRSDFLDAATTWHYLPEAMRTRYHAHNPQSGSFPAYVNWMKEFLMQKLELIIPATVDLVLALNNVSNTGNVTLDLSPWLPATCTLALLLGEMKDTGSAGSDTRLGLLDLVSGRGRSVPGHHVNNKWSRDVALIKTNSTPAIRYNVLASGSLTATARIRIMAYFVQT